MLHYAKHELELEKCDLQILSDTNKNLMTYV